MLSRRVGAAAKTSVGSGDPPFSKAVGWGMLWLRQLLWQDVSMFVVVGMDGSFGLS